MTLRPPITLLSIAIGTLLAGCAPTARGGAGAEATVTADLAITRVAVIDVERGRVVADQDVLLTGNRIMAVVPSGSRQLAGAPRVVDGTGKYVMPGLWEQGNGAGGRDLGRYREPGMTTMIDRAA